MNVELHHPALNCAAGTEWPALWQALCEPGRPVPWPGGAAFQAHPVPSPALAACGIDRKLARTMEKQAQLCVAGAASALQQWTAGSPEALDRTGLYLGLPSIDEEVPPLAALQRRDAGGREPWLAIMLAETPPFSGLSLLNSSACAHISATFGLRGALAAFSPACDAGLQALVEGVLSVAEGENTHALIGAVSAKLHPLLPAQLAHAGWIHGRDAAPGEGAAFLLATAASGGGRSVRVAAYVRGFVPTTGDATRAAFARLLDRALTAAGRCPRDIGWVLPATGPAAPAHERALRLLAGLFDIEAGALPVARTEEATGLLGPAAPLVHAGLAVAGLQSGRRLAWNAHAGSHEDQALTAPVVMLLAWAPEGACVIVLLERGPQ